MLGATKNGSTSIENCLVPAMKDLTPSKPSPRMGPSTRPLETENPAEHDVNAGREGQGTSMWDDEEQGDRMGDTGKVRPRSLSETNHPADDSSQTPRLRGEWVHVRDNDVVESPTDTKIDKMKERGDATYPAREERIAVANYSMSKARSLEERIAAHEGFMTSQLEAIRKEMEEKI